MSEHWGQGYESGWGQCLECEHRRPLAFLSILAGKLQCNDGWHRILWARPTETAQEATKEKKPGQATQKGEDAP